jgi:uncharacterized protein YneF (UPF0154 family)
LAGETSGRAGRIVLTLLLLNGLVLGVFLALNYWGDRDRSLPEFNADKIRMLEQPPVKARQAVTEASLAASQASSEAALCFRVAGMDQARYQAFREILAKLDVDGSRFSLLTDNKFPWWVYWPPEYEAAQRDAVIKKIAQAGVKDVVPVGKGAMAQSFSLGMFPLEVQARAHRDKLRQTGLEKVEYGIRPALGTFRIRLDPESPARSQALKALMPAWVEVLESRACGQ